MISNGANINAKDSSGNIALIEAVKNNHKKVIIYLLNKGADVNIESSKDFTPLFSALKNNNQELAKFLINRNANPNFQNKEGENAIHYSAMSGNQKAIQFLIDKGVNINEKTAYGITALDIASFLNNIKLAEFILSQTRESQINIKKLCDQALIYGIGHKDIVELMLENGATINAKDENGLNAFHFASFINDLEAVEFLNDQGLSITDKIKDLDFTALHFATIGIDRNSLKKSQSDFNILKNLKKIMSPQTIKKIKPERIFKEFQQINPFFNQKLIEFIINQGADINAKAIFDISPIDLATLTGNQELTEYLIDQGAEINFEIKKNNYTLLHLAALSGNSKLVKYIVDEQGAEVNKEASAAGTALMLASGSGHKEVIEVLIDKGAVVDKANQGGWTALMIAAKNGHFEAVKTLIGKGARTDCKKSTLTAFGIAKDRGHKEIAAFIAKQSSAITDASPKLLVSGAFAVSALIASATFSRQ